MGSRHVRWVADENIVAKIPHHDDIETFTKEFDFESLIELNWNPIVEQLGEEQELHLFLYPSLNDPMKFNNKPYTTYLYNIKLKHECRTVDYAKEKPIFENLSTIGEIYIKQICKDEDEQFVSILFKPIFSRLKRQMEPDYKTNQILIYKPRGGFVDEGLDLRIDALDSDIDVYFDN